MNAEMDVGTNKKAFQINIDGKRYGTFAEIGAGQEVARRFFHVGGAAGTIAKTMSAYDMTFSDAIYGPTDRYVSRVRLGTMLDQEYKLLIERLDEKLGKERLIFVFADTVAARDVCGLRGIGGGDASRRYGPGARCGGRDHGSRSLGYGNRLSGAAWRRVGWMDDSHLNHGYDPMPKHSWKSAPEMQLDAGKAYSAVLHTDRGDIAFRLLDGEAPKTVNNFVFLSRHGFYDGVIFHRTIDGFMIQTGDPEGTGRGGPGYQFEDEPVKRRYTAGTVAMANGGKQITYNGMPLYTFKGAKALSTKGNGVDGKWHVIKLPASAVTSTG